MDQSLRIAAALSVLVGGFLVAMLFRHDSPAGGLTPADRDNRLELRRQSDPYGGGQVWADPHGLLDPPAQVPVTPRLADQTATILKPMDPGEPPPALPRDYPGTGISGTSRWGTAIGLTFPRASGTDHPARLHKIVDGDTLKTLAERYFGSAARAEQIYEANRDVLPGPEVLPIGVELKIPISAVRPVPADDVTPKRPVVPIPDHTR